MKICMVDPSLFTGRYDDALCDALGARGHDVTLLGRPLRSTDALSPVHYRYVPRFFRLGERLREILGEGKAGQAAKGLDYAVDAAVGPIGAFAGDVVHFQWAPFARLDACWINRLHKRSALVHTVHNAQPFHGDGARAAAQSRGYFDLLRRFDALIVHGASTAAAIQARGVDPDRIHIVPHPPMTLAAASRDDLAAIAPPAPDVPRILLFGTLRPYKGLDLLVDAALSLWRAGHVFELAIAGKPFMDVQSVFEQVRAEGFADRLLLDLGFLPEARLDAHLERADILVFPYKHIDSSGAFLSALRYGAAMVTSDAGMFGNIEGDAVARFPVGNALALAEILRSLIVDPAAREGAGRRALGLLKSLGDWDAAAAATEKVYDAAITVWSRR